MRVCESYDLCMSSRCHWLLDLASSSSIFKATRRSTIAMKKRCNLSRTLDTPTLRDASFAVCRAMTPAFASRCQNSIYETRELCNGRCAIEMILWYVNVFKSPHTGSVGTLKCAYAAKRGVLTGHSGKQGSESEPFQRGPLPFRNGRVFGGFP